VIVERDPPETMSSQEEETELFMHSEKRKEIKKKGGSYHNFNLKKEL